jgi:hypothetical protein
VYTKKVPNIVTVLQVTVVACSCIRLMLIWTGFDSAALLDVLFDSCNWTGLNDGAALLVDTALAAVSCAEWNKALLEVSFDSCSWTGLNNGAALLVDTTLAAVLCAEWNKGGWTAPPVNSASSAEYEYEVSLLIAPMALECRLECCSTAYKIIKLSASVQYVSIPCHYLLANLQSLSNALERLPGG